MARLAGGVRAGAGRSGAAVLGLGLLTLVGALAAPSLLTGAAFAAPHVSVAGGSRPSGAEEATSEDAAPAASPPSEATPASADLPDPMPPAGPADAGPADACSEALRWVEAAGLHLPPGVDYRCPSAQFAHHGTACWDAWPCPDAAFVEINIALIGDGTPAYLHHVVAHEVCHILDFQAVGTSTEAHADDCAAAHGAPG